MTGFGAADWEARYRAGEGGRTAPSSSLRDVVAALAPGRALDAGCGRGGDARWLAGRGWSVTAVDVSATALATGDDDRVDWQEADLLTWEPGRSFDLVTSHYVHVPAPVEHLVARLAAWVAPGGTLLVVGHGAGHGHGAELSPDAAAVLGDGFEVLAAEPRTHLLRRPDGTCAVLSDVVLHARRAGSP